MKIDIKEINTGNPVRDAYYQWAKSVGYLDFRNRLYNEKEFKELVYIDSVDGYDVYRLIPDWPVGLSLPELLYTKPSFINYQLAQCALNKIRHKSFKFTGKVFEDDDVKHPWDDKL